MGEGALRHLHDLSLGYPESQLGARGDGKCRLVLEDIARLDPPSPGSCQHHHPHSRSSPALCTFRSYLQSCCTSESRCCSQAAQMRLNECPHPPKVLLHAPLCSPLVPTSGPGAVYESCISCCDHRALFLSLSLCFYNREI